MQPDSSSGHAAPPTRPDDHWSKENEDLIREWAERWRTARRMHQKWTQICWAGSYLITLPSIGAPLLFYWLTRNSTEAEKDNLTSLGFICSTALAGLQSFLHLDSIGSRHLLAANGYAALIGEATSELTRAVDSRRSVTLAMADYRARSQMLVMAAPFLPERCWCPLRPSGSRMPDTLTLAR